MPFIVSKSAFENELYVAGKEDAFSSTCIRLCDMIERYEPEYLSKVLGYGFYKEVLAALGDGSNVEQKYKDLVDGVDYTVSGVLYQWRGLRHYTASYIYYWYMRMNFTDTTLVGEVSQKGENSIGVSVSDKMVKAYNDSSWGRGEFWYNWWFYCCRGVNYQDYAGQRKLYHYLTNNTESFPDFKSVQMNYVEPINVFNL